MFSCFWVCHLQSDNLCRDHPRVPHGVPKLTHPHLSEKNHKLNHSLWLLPQISFKLTSIDFLVLELFYSVFLLHCLPASPPCTPRAHRYRAKTVSENQGVDLLHNQLEMPNISLNEIDVDYTCGRLPRRWGIPQPLGRRGKVCRCRCKPST